MSQADLADEPDLAVAPPPSWLCTLPVAVGWAVAAALCAGIAWTTAAVAAGRLAGVRVPGAPDGGEAGATLEMTAIGAGCGLLVGAIAGIFLVRRHGTEGRRETLPVVTVVGAVIGALGSGLSVPMTTMFGGLPPEVSSGLAWAVAGLVAGFAGGARGRRGPEPGGNEASRAATWAIVGGLGGALAGAAGVVAGELFFVEWHWHREVTLQLFEMTAYTAGTGAAAGLFVGAAFGLLSERGRRVFGSQLDSCGRLALLGGLAGLLGGYAPFFVVALGPSVPPEVAFALAGAAAGVVVGIIGHAWTRRPAEPNVEVEDDSAGPVATAAPLRPAGRPMLRLLPVLAVAVLTFVAAIATFPPGTRVVLVAVGLLGLAVAYVQAGQEQRIRELEHRLRLAQPPAADGIPITADARPRQEKLHLISHSLRPYRPREYSTGSGVEWGPTAPGGTGGYPCTPRRGRARDR
jgi:hypothetical protein